MKLVLCLMVCSVYAQTSPDLKYEKKLETFNDENFTSTVSVETTTDVHFSTELNCEGNDTCMSFVPNVTEATLHENTETIKNEYKSSDVEFCTCNLQEGACDINCCCDNDCTNDDKTMFTHCADETLKYDTRYCEYSKYLYMNNTPFQWHVNQNGLFCVLKSNTPPHYILQRRQPLISFEESEEQKLHKFSWGFQDFQTTQFNETTFKYGRPIWIVQNLQLKKLKVPNKFVTDKCLIEETILNLRNNVHSCSQTDLNANNEQLKAKYYFQSTFIVNVNNFINMSNLKNQWFQVCPKNICLPLTPKICENHLENCKNISENDTRIDVNCNQFNSKTVCKNLVKNLQYNFYYNSSRGFTTIDLLFTLENITLENGKTLKFLQTFSVNFQDQNDRKNFTYSGNPGYKIGSHLLIGQVLNVGNKTHPELKIDKTNDTFQERFLTLPNNVNGKCVSDSTNYISIEFGYNVVTRCKQQHYIFVDKKYMYTEIKKTKTGNETKQRVNSSEICKDIQKNIFKLLKIQDKKFGSFGNANPDDIKEWTNVMYQNSPGSVLNDTSGQFITETSLHCRNVINLLKINIFHARIDFEHIINQEKILGVTYELRNVNTEFVYDKQNNLIEYELNLESQVVFYDITSPKIKRIVDPMSLEIKLPYDFFYPFVKIDNSARSIKNYFCNFVFVVFAIVWNK